MAKRVGILTLPYNSNYGGVAQSVALSRFLTAHGYETVLLTRRRALTPLQAMLMPVLARLPMQNIGGVRAQEQARALLRGTIEASFTVVTPPLRSRSALGEAVRRHRLDAVIVGSDQVWRLDYLPAGSHGEFFLDFVGDPRIRRIAYAASFGVGTWMYPDRTAEIARLLARFDAVSVREDSGVAICRDSFGRDDAVHVLDPTLLVDPAVYREMIGPSGPSSGRKALCYLLDEPPACPAVLAALGPDYEVARISPDDGGPVGLPHWLRAFRDADFVITDSFHGTVFAIVFGKPFVSILNHGRGGDRFASLLRALGLSDRLIDAGEVLGVEEIVARPIDYAAVDARLNRLRATSAEFLLAALEGRGLS